MADPVHGGGDEGARDRWVCDVCARTFGTRLGGIGHLDKRAPGPEGYEFCRGTVRAGERADAIPARESRRVARNEEYLRLAWGGMSRWRAFLIACLNHRRWSNR